MLGTGSGNVEVSSKSEKGVESLSDVPWRRFLQNKALWGLGAAHCSFGVGPLVCLSWLPSYYSDVSCCSCKSAKNLISFNCSQRADILHTARFKVLKLGKLAKHA